MLVSRFDCSLANAVGGFADSTVRLYDLQRVGRPGGGDGALRGAGGAACTLLYGHSGAVYGVDSSADGQLLYSGSADGCAPSKFAHCHLLLARVVGESLKYPHLAALI